MLAALDAKYRSNEPVELTKPLLACNVVVVCAAANGARRQVCWAKANSDKNSVRVKGGRARFIGVLLRFRQHQQKTCSDMPLLKNWRNFQLVLRAGLLG